MKKLLFTSILCSIAVIVFHKCNEHWQNRSEKPQKIENVSANMIQNGLISRQPLRQKIIFSD